MSIFSKKALRNKIDFLVKNHNIDKYSVVLGLSYVQYCKNINRENLSDYTLCAIILANKYLNDYYYNIHDMTSSLDIPIQRYKNIELELLNKLSYNLRPSFITSISTN